MGFELEGLGLGDHDLGLGFSCAGEGPSMR